jgi:phosphoribosylformylglycinamidine synthase I
MRIGVITFPGSLDDHDTTRAVKRAGAEAIELWHKDKSLNQVDAVILPGGFSYGDYLRCGAIAKLAPVMQEVIDQAHKGLPVLGICNGFQILCEAQLLPGALTRNQGLHFTCLDQKLKVENNNSAWTNQFNRNQEIVIPLKNGEGCYQADKNTLEKLEANNQVLFRYIENPNGSMNDIAGISNEKGKIVGLMPHPEHAIDRLTGPSEDGLKIFKSAINYLLGASV